MSWNDAEHVVCVRLDTLGDVLLTTPAIRALKDSRPDRRVTLLTSPAGGDVAPLVPEIDDVIVYDAPWMKATPPRVDSRPEYEMAARLREAAFDAAVIFTVYSQNPLPSALLCYLAGIPLRLAHCRENPYQLLTHWVRDLEPERGVRHEVRRQLDLVATVGSRTLDESISVHVHDIALQTAARRLARIGVDAGSPWVVVHPGATAPSRRYPPEGFAEVATKLDRHGFQIVFTGSASERTLVDHVRRETRAPTRSLAGQLQLVELAAILSLAPLLISNNTGPVHLAAGVGTPVVDLYALTNPQHTPWGVPSKVLFHDVPCKYCYSSVCPQGHHDCLRKVAPDSIVRAALELLRAHSKRGRVMPHS